MQEAKQDVHAALKTKGLVENELRLSQSALHDAMAQIKGQNSMCNTLTPAQDYPSEKAHMTVGRFDQNAIFVCMYASELVLHNQYQRKVSVL